MSASPPQSRSMTETIPGTHLDRFPAHREGPFHPPRAYLDLQRERPVHRVTLPSGLEAVLITRHEDVRAVLDDERMSADETVPGYPFLYEGAFESPLKGTFMRADGEAHYRIRRMLMKDFTVRRAQAIRPEVEAIVAECLDAMAAHGPPADIVTDFAFPVPSRTICRILGVPYEDREVFESNTRAMINTASTQEQVGAAMQAIFGYLDELVTRKSAEPGDDLISRLIVEELEPGRLDRREMITIALILLVGGHETTATMLGLGTYALLEHAAQRAELLADPGLWGTAVDELLRHQTIVQNPIQRVALDDVEVGGEVIRKGEGVLLVLEAANRDPRAYAEPSHMDLRRGARNHVAFSFGPHHCLGHAIARMELEVAFRGLFTRFPGLRLGGEPPLRPPGVGLFGVESLPVTW
ncbi:MAG: cytochrome P450 [Streptosporangiales bacterium]|nr:cytochrome P450 [Streptosporangiales bacterium]